MAIKGEDDNQPLDLGLSGLLSGESAAASSSSMPPSVPPSSNSNAAEAAVEQPPRSQLQGLAREGRWNELIDQAEAILSGEDSSEARVWWVRGHLGALSMPASFLAAPLEALCRRVAGTPLSPELNEALQETAPLLVKRLEDVAENDLAASLRAALERLALLPPGSAERERRIRKKTDAKMKSLAAQGLTLAEDGSIVPVQAAKANAARVDFNVMPLPGRLKRKANAKKGISGTRLAGVMVVACALLVVALLWSFEGVPTWLGSSEIQIASEGFISNGEAAEQVIPVLDERGKVGSLSALFYSIGSAGAGGDTQPSQTGATGAVDGQGIAAANSSSGVDGASSGAKRQLEQINTSGPVEGPEFQRGVERSGGPFGSGIGPVQPELPAVNDSPSIRHPGPAVDVARSGRAIRSTSVYAGASYGSEVVGRLEPGDRVMIEGNAGRWLRLRSRKGNGGYVRREDVEEF